MRNLGLVFYNNHLKSKLLIYDCYSMYCGSKNINIIFFHSFKKSLFLDYIIIVNQNLWGWGRGVSIVIHWDVVNLTLKDRKSVV